MAEKYFTPIFERISEKKRNKIIDVSIREFANLGFNNANINVIAKKSNVSVGSLYKYFKTKENLFLTATHFGIETIEQVLDEILKSEDDLFEKIEHILRLLQKHCRLFPEFHKLYNEITSESSSDLVRRLSSDMETISSQCYTTLIIKAKKDGVIATDIDERIFSYCLDNLFLNFQFSYSCDYYKERMKIYVGDDVFTKDDYVVQEIMKFIRRAFAKIG